MNQEYIKIDRNEFVLFPGSTTKCPTGKDSVGYVNLGVTLHTGEEYQGKKCKFIKKKFDSVTGTSKIEVEIIEIVRNIKIKKDY